MQSSRALGQEGPIPTNSKMAASSGESAASVAEGLRPKKRLRKEDSWVRNSSKSALNGGLQYTAKNQKAVMAKRRSTSQCCGQPHVTKCDYRALSDVEKDDIFSAFYKLGDYNRQNAYDKGI